MTSTVKTSFVRFVKNKGCSKNKQPFFIILQILFLGDIRMVENLATEEKYHYLRCENSQEHAQGIYCGVAYGRSLFRA